MDDVPWRAWSEALVRGPVGTQFLRRLLSDWPLGNVEKDNALVIVRRLALRLRVKDDPPDAEVAKAWASGLVSELRRMAHAPDSTGFDGHATDDVAVFPSVVDAEGAALMTRLRPDTPPWWAPRVLEARSAAEIFAGWLAAVPGEAPARILQVTDGAPAAVAALLSEQAAAALTDALEAAWSGEPTWVAPEPDPEHAQVAPAHLALLLACQARIAERPQPALTDASDADEERELPPLARATPRPESEVIPPTDPVFEPSPATAAPEATPVDVAGLFFLLHPLSRHPFLADAPWSDWPGRLASLWACFDAAWLDTTPLEFADRVREANAPAVAGFVGAWPPPEPSVEPSVARRVLAAVAADLPEEVRAIEVPHSRLARRVPAPTGAPWETLGRVILRPGRHRMTATHIDVFLPLSTVDLALRRLGWDTDPGFLPGLRRTIRFHYEGQTGG